MRDILVCKHCDFFMENQIDPVMRINLKYDSGLVETSKQYFFRRHNCEFSCLGTRVGRLNNVEYYKMDIPPECPYKFEHEMYEMNGEHCAVNYGVSRHFGKTRTCQHCGSTIPKSKKCPNCGYNYFETYKPYSEKAIFAQIATLFILIVVLVVTAILK